MMEKVYPKAVDVTENVRRTSNETFDSLLNSISNIKAPEHGSSDDEDAPRMRYKKRVKRFSDSDSDNGREKTQNGNLVRLDENSHSKISTLQNDSSESDTNITENTVHKSVLQRNGNLSDSGKTRSDDEDKNDDSSDTEINITKSILHKSRIIQRKSNLSNSEESENDNAVKNKEQQLRMKNKRNNLRNKFKSLLTSREKEQSFSNINAEENKKSDNDISSESGEEMASIEKIKQKIKKRMSFKPSICDPDTSEEETSRHKPIVKQKRERKMTKLTSPKPQRMSAKQAMENMQKIKSESNRMLREKEVSLPYHRPKALSLKDIMSRRKPALSSDGKALPIKMNEQQLKQYAKMLEERQKEMMELCKSESEDEENNEKDSGINETNADETISIENANNANNITDNDNSIKLNETTTKEVCCSETVDGNLSTDTDIDELANDPDSETSLRLVYNNSANSVIDNQMSTNEEVTNLAIENENIDAVPENIVETTIAKETRHMNSKSTEKYEKNNFEHNTDADGQLHLDSENADSIINKNEATEVITEAIEKDDEIAENNFKANTSDQGKEKSVENEDMEVDSEFSDNEMNMSDIDDIIANAEIIKDIEDKVNSQFLVRDKPLNLNPKLTGGPGMVIDLDESDLAPRKSGIELLKERFTYFSKLKTPEEMERERETKMKPGTQYKKLKQELEEKIAEQRSIEWAKRLEDEKQQQKELKVLRGEESEDDIDKIEAALDGKEEDVKEESDKSESDEEEPIENDVEIRDKPRTKNTMLDDEAKESDCEDDEDKVVKNGGIETENDNEEGIEQNAENEDDDGIDADNDDDGEENVSESDDSDESSESEEEQPSTIKKSRILKAFEDSDEEDAAKLSDTPVVLMEEVKGTSESKSGSSSKIENFVESQVISQDEELQLAQVHKSASEDLFTSQESALLVSEARDKTKDLSENDEALTQTFSILDSTNQATVDLDLNSSGKIGVCDTQSLEFGNADDIASLCPLTESQNNLPLPSQIPITQLSQSQPIGEDILALCTGQFYNNQFVSQLEQNQIPTGESQKYDAFDKYLSQDSRESQEQASIHCSVDIRKEMGITDTVEPKVTDSFIELNADDGNKENRKDKIVDDNLKSILDELADPEFDSPKPNKFFVGSKNAQKYTTGTENQGKKKFIIDSDDETNAAETTEIKKRKKFKKKKPEKRALQISDDEEEISEQEEIDEYESEIEEENPDRLVEYDSEENEIEVQPKNPKKKRKMTEFFENEAELTSEDEWVGSGDEDEAGLDRMEREAGDDETFHQGKLQQELGQIHMREVLDQDKREVRLIQELMFEDGDLGDGGRQRKFRWNNMDGEEPGTVPDDFTDTQEEEFESEEQWRKQRHEREMFLRKMHNKDEPEESLNVSVNRSMIIKANLMSKTVSSLLMEGNVSSTEKTEGPAVEKKTAKDVPSPKKPFALFQQNYQSSLLSRSRGALARLAALATPLAADDDANVGTLGPSNRRNFVFAALTPDQKETKVTKRKAESNPSTPKLVKKMRTEAKQNTSKSLLDHFKV